MNIDLNNEKTKKRFQSYLDDMEITQQDIDDAPSEFEQLIHAHFQLNLAIEEAEKRDAAKH